MKAFFSNIKYYLIIAGGIGSAILAYLYQRRGEKIRDLIYEKTKTKAEAEIAVSQEALKAKIKAFEEKKKKLEELLTGKRS